MKINDNILTALAGPGVKHYPMFEHLLFQPIFYVETSIRYNNEDTGDEEQIRSNYIVDRLQQALNIQENDIVYDFDISILTPRHMNDDNELSISTIAEILEGEDSAGQSSFIYVCKNGKRFIDSPLAKNESEISNISSIYKKISSK